MEAVVMPQVGLVVGLFLIGAFSVAGGVFGMWAYPRFKVGEKPWEILAGWLMALMGVHIVFLNFWESVVFEIPVKYALLGAGAGWAAAALAMKAYRQISRHEHNGHHSLGILVLLILAIHEITEGAAIAEIFFEVGGGSVPLSASAFSLGALAVHEFPEGVLLTLPFFLSKKVREGLAAVIVNQAVFVVAGLVFYHVIFDLKAFAVHEVIFASVVPAGAVAYLGWHELGHAWLRTEKLVGVSRRVVAGGMALASLAFAVTGYLAKVHIEELGGWREVEGGHQVETAVPCEKEVSLSDCLSH